MTRCEGMTRHGGMMTLGMPRWEQCEEEATIKITFEQTAGGYGHDITEGTMPCCHECWKKAEQEKGIKIISVKPLMDASCSENNNDTEMSQ